MPARKLRAVPDYPSRVVCYIRVSALMGRGGDDFHSPEIQLSAIRRSIAMAGLREVAVIDDDIDQTGRTFDRDGIDKIREMADARQIDAVAVYDLSRLGRNVLESLQFIKWLADRGVGVISTCENVDTSTPAGVLMLTQFLSIAQYRSDEIGRHWASIIARRAERGFTHGTTATGYIKREKQLYIHPVEGPAMQLAFEQYADGESIGEIARQVAVTLGRSQYSTELKKRFKKVVYLGQVVLHGRTLPGQHERLVDDDTWQACQDRMARERWVPSRHLGPTWSLVGLAYCPNEHHLQRNSVPDKPGQPKVDRIKCHRGAQRGVLGRCSIGRPRLDQIEAEVLRRVQEYVKELRDDVHARTARQIKSANARVEKATYDDQLVTVRKAMSRIAKEWALNRIPESAYQDAMADFLESETTLLTARAVAETVVNMPSPTELANLGERLVMEWPWMTAAEKNRLMRRLVKRVVVRAPAFYREPVADRMEVELC